MKSIRKSQRQEKQVARKFGGSVNSGSGNGPYRKNDVRTSDLSLELKYTDKESFVLKLADLIKAEKYAIMDDRDFAFGICMGGRNWYVVSEEDLMAMRGLHT